MHGKGEDETDLCQLRGLEGEAAQLVPGVVIGITGVEADGQRANGHVADEQGGQHKAPCQGHVHRPHLHQAAVIDIGQQHRNDQPDEGCTCLHRRPAVIAQTGDLACDLIHGKAIALLGCPARKRCHSHHAAEDAQQQVELIRPLQILSNAFQESTTFRFQMHTGPGCTHRQHKPSLSLLYTDGTAFSICRVEQPCKICVGA